MKATIGAVAAALIIHTAGAQVVPDNGFQSVGRGAPMLEILPSLSDLPRKQPELSNYLLERTPFVGPSRACGLCRSPWS